MENKTREWNPQTEVAVLKNEIEYLKRRVAELERANLYKGNSRDNTAVAGWPKGIVSPPGFDPSMFDIKHLKDTVTSEDVLGWLRGDNIEGV